MGYRQIHIGELIQAYVKENNINGAELARKIKKTRQNVYDLYKRDDIEVKLLLTLCDVLNHNFLDDIYPQKKDQVAVDNVFDALKTIIKKEIADKTNK